MPYKIQPKGDSEANWAAMNPKLSRNELGIEWDTGKCKIGNGSTTWNNLEYIDWGISGGAPDHFDINGGQATSTYVYRAVNGGTA